jgi:hypothetical protein
MTRKMSESVSVNRGRALQDANAYARSLHSPAKRAYALALVRAWHFGQEPPDAPPALSTMGAQAVRMRVDSILAPVTQAEAEAVARALAALQG